MHENRTKQEPLAADQQPREAESAEVHTRDALPQWDQELDLRHHPPLDMAPVEPIDWSRYVASRMNAYETGW